MGEFVHLHTHTGYSLLDGAGKISDIIEKAKELGMDAMAITDHGSMFGCVEFYKEAKKQGIKPIIGCEIYVATKSMDIKNVDIENETCHLILLVKNDQGYQNLMKIVSKASIDGFYYKPRVDHDYLSKHSDGIIATSACQGGEIQKYLLRGDVKRAKETALFYNEIFKEGFYLELQYHGTPEDLKLNEELVKLSRDTGIPLVCTNDIHYVNKEDFKSHDVLICIQTGKTIDDENRMKYSANDFYIKSPQEMARDFAYVPEALENTVKIAEECNFDYEFHVSKLPNFPLAEGVDHGDYLEKICYEGLITRYHVFKKLENLVTENETGLLAKKVRAFAEGNPEAKLYVERMDYELNIIKTMGYVDYFLIVWDFIKFANDNDIMTGPGRGSAAGSIIAYSLRITKLDPIKYNLIFERFLNPERISMPDIDSDFCYERRQEVIDYVVQKYGKDNVSQIVTFGTMAARVCIRDVGRAMDYAYSEVDRIAKMIPAMLNITIEKAIEINPELKAAYDGEPRIKELIDIAKRLEGLPRHTSTHAAGVVIASKPLVNYVPLLKSDEAILAQFDMITLEDLGLLKMDFLGLRTLTVIRDTINIVKETRGIELDIDKIDFEDKNVYEMIGEGKTVGVFQLESSGMINFMKELKPDSLEDIIAGISLYRPGPMAEIPTYLANKKKAGEITYITKELEPILNVTYGCMVYQEQVMQIVRDLAGYSMGRSDLVRRAMSKKKHKVMEEERHNFIYGIVDENGKVEVEGCLRRGISEIAANKIYDLMMDFASYAFPKSHAAAYSIVAYDTAYLIYYYPVEYMAAILNSIIGNSEKISFYIRYAESIGIKILPPSINKSHAKFTVDNGCIRFGLASLKNVGMNIINGIVDTRQKYGEFKDFLDFCNKVSGECISKRVVESLIKVGAFNDFKVYRSQLLMMYERILDSVANKKKQNIIGQISLFETSAEANESLKFTYPNIKEFEKKNILAMEKEMSGMYLSGHPLDEYEETINILKTTKISNIVVRDEKLDDEETVVEADLQKVEDMQENNVIFADGEMVVIAGLIASVSRKTTKKNDFMAFIIVEDIEESIECIVFPKTLAIYQNLIEEDNLIVIRGRISYKDEVPKILCEHIEQLYKINKEKIYVLVEDASKVPGFTSLMRNNIDKFKGRTPVYICTKDKNTYLLDRNYWVNGEIEVLQFLKENCGEENVKVLT